MPISTSYANLRPTVIPPGHLTCLVLNFFGSDISILFIFPPGCQQILSIQWRRKRYTTFYHNLVMIRNANLKKKIQKKKQLVSFEVCYSTWLFSFAPAAARTPLVNGVNGDGCYISNGFSTPSSTSILGSVSSGPVRESHTLPA